MPTKTDAIEYQTVVVGAAYLVKGILRRLDFVSAIDDVLEHQPEIETTYGSLAQVIVANRLTFQPSPFMTWRAGRLSVGWIGCLAFRRRGWTTTGWARCWRGWRIIR
jgi:hypothetical protein